VRVWAGSGGEEGAKRGSVSSRKSVRGRFVIVETESSLRRPSEKREKDDGESLLDENGCSTALSSWRR
jgi:hypothetical protein